MSKVGIMWLAMLVAASAGAGILDIEPGDPLERVVSILGEPEGVIRTADYALLTYSRGKVELRSNQVTRIELLAAEPPRAAPTTPTSQPATATAVPILVTRPSAEEMAALDAERERRRAEAIQREIEELERKIARAEDRIRDADARIGNRSSLGTVYTSYAIPAVYAVPSYSYWPSATVCRPAPRPYGGYSGSGLSISFSSGHAAGRVATPSVYRGGCAPSMPRYFGPSCRGW